MDCMQMLQDCTKEPTNNLMAKVANRLRPFRFVLPFTFLYDIFGGLNIDSIVEFNFPEFNDNKFKDKSALMDRFERKWVKSNENIKCFTYYEILCPRRIEAFLSGGYLANALDLTNDSDDIDIYCRHSNELVAFFSQMIDKSIDKKSDRRIWASVPIEKYMKSSVNIKKKIGLHSLTGKDVFNPSIIFENHKHILTSLEAVYTLNPDLPIVRHWKQKYGNHLSQIIVYDTSFEFNDYTVFKMLSEFDLPICRNALVFSYIRAYHLREAILYELYGIHQCITQAKVKTFIDEWQDDEKKIRCEFKVKCSYFPKKLNHNYVQTIMLRTVLNCSVMKFY